MVGRPEIFYTDRHIQENNPTYKELKHWHEISGLLYKSMNLKDKLPAKTEDEQLRLLATDAQAPPIVKDNIVLTGVKESDRETVK